MVTSTFTLHSILAHNTLRTFDEVRRLKLAIADLEKEPFWDSNSKQTPNCTYTFNGLNIRDSSPAEACERDKILASFLFSSLSSNPLYIEKNNAQIPLLNLSNSGELTEFLWSEGQISFEMYLKSRFSTGKLDFSQVDEKMGFNKVQTAEQNLFLTTFNKFEELTWDQIHKDRGLDFKEYHGSVGTQYRGMTTYKFRASEKIRCHGYRKRDQFMVIGFEIDHRLSDHG